MVTSARYKPVHDNAYMKTYALMEEMGLPLVVPRRLQLGRPRPRQHQPLHHGACAGLHRVQHDQPRQLGGERPAGALPQAQVMLDRERPRLGPVHDAALRQRIHDAQLRMPVAQGEAERLYAPDVLHHPADGDGQQPQHAGGDVQDDEAPRRSSATPRTIRTGTWICRARSTTCRSSTRRPSATSSAATPSASSTSRTRRSATGSSQARAAKAAAQ